MARSVATFVNDIYEEEPYDDQAGTKLSRVHITRTFSGELEGRSTAELLTAVTQGGSAGYVALDRISGRLQGREGTFVLQHHGTVSPTEALTAGSVVPDSGTGELRGLRGHARIVVEDGTHELILDYELDE